ncbi:MAG: helix-turn-helix domain-containing protein [Defluviitaleaceae bacterium]|nr:helix-turn-helix domain-containing protein [Defluviitaleaceae bacterium]MCL2275842.1 helix-turn-helix domain-containing protein [Defluviitaleaceae bacterium]
MVATVVIIALSIGMVLTAVAAIGAILWMRNREQKRDEVLQSAEALATLDEALDDALKELNKVGNLVQKEIGEKYQAMLFLYNLLEEKQKSQVVLPEKIAADIARAEAEVTAAEVVPARAVTPAVPSVEVSAPTVVEVPAMDEPVFPPEEADDFEDETDNAGEVFEEEVPEAEVLDMLAPAPSTAKEKKAAAKKKSASKKSKEVPAPAPAIQSAPRKRASNPKHTRVRELNEQGMSIADIAKELGIGKGEITLILEMSGKR